MQAVLVIITLLSLGTAAGMGTLLWRNTQKERRRTAARIAVLEADLYGSAAPAPAAVDRPPRGLVVAAAGVCVVGTIAVLAGVFTGSGTAEPRVRESRTAGFEPAARQPLELMALTHERDADQLTVRGIVRNPARSGSLSDLTAVVLVFDRTGGFLASGSGRVSGSPLPSGSESSFVVTVPYSGEIGRYRVSFRIGNGVVPHVDRRG